MNRFQFVAESEQATERLGAALAELLPDGATVALCGTLGCGKTRLVQAVAVALGIPRESVTSPTFVLCHEYHGRRTLFHLDAYRLRSDDELFELGAEELFDSPAITLVEWADRVARCLPPDRVDIHVEVTGQTSRLFDVLGVGDRYRSVIDALRERLAVPPDAGSAGGGTRGDC